MKVAVLASGRGSNFQSIINSCEKGLSPNTNLKHLIVNNQDAYAIKIAKKHNISYTFIESKNRKREYFDQKVLEILKKYEIEIIVLAGFMRILSPILTQTYKNRIINIHPSLLPLFPGPNAHKDTIDAGVKHSGCTVHIVDEGVDTGPIIIQDTIELDEGETVESLSNKILPLEHKIFPKAIELLCSNKIQVHGRNVTIKPD